MASRLLSHKRQTSRVCRHLGTEASARNHCALTCGLSSRGDMCAYVNIKHHHVKVDAFQPHSCQHNMRWLATDAREGTDVVVPGPHRCPCHRGGAAAPPQKPIECSKLKRLLFFKVNHVCTKDKSKCCGREGGREGGQKKKGGKGGIACVHPYKRRSECLSTRSAPYLQSPLPTPACQTACVVIIMSHRMCNRTSAMQ